MAKRTTPGRKSPHSTFRRILRCRYLYLMLAPVLLNFAVFHYWPMYGAQIAFRQFTPVKGITGSPWVGIANFKNFFQSHLFLL